MEETKDHYYPNAQLTPETGDTIAIVTSDDYLEVAVVRRVEMRERYGPIVVCYSVETFVEEHETPEDGLFCELVGNSVELKNVRLLFREGVFKWHL